MSIQNKPTAQKSPAKTGSIEDMVAYLIKYQKSLAILVGLVLVVLVGMFAWHSYQDKQDNLAQNQMYQATYEFEAGHYEKALIGEEGYAGFLDIIKEYPFTKAANLAHLYSGIIYMHQGNYTDAIQQLKSFKSKDFLLQARAWSLLGDAYSQQEAYQQAVTYYLKAADYKPNEYFTPIYLVKAALAYEANKDYPAASKCYERITQNYPKSFWYEEACKQVSRLAGLS